MLALVLVLILSGLCGAVATAQAQATGLPAPAAEAAVSDAVRFLQSCQQAQAGGRVDPACEGAAFSNQLDRLQAEAMRTRNPALLSLVGDAHEQAMSADAYQWYLMAAVRGDPYAMARLADLYNAGRGVPRDRVKAFGYARATQRLALPGSAAAARAERLLSDLGRELSAQELALAERFAMEMQGLPDQGRRLPGLRLGPHVGAGASLPHDGAATTEDASQPPPDPLWTGPLMHAVPRGLPDVGHLPGTGSLPLVVMPEQPLQDPVPGTRNAPQIPASGISPHVEPAQGEEVEDVDTRQGGHGGSQ